MSKKKKNNKDIDKYKWMNITSIFLIFGLNILAFLIRMLELSGIIPFLGKFHAIEYYVFPITTLIGIVMLIWVRVKKPEDKVSKTIAKTATKVGCVYVIFLFIGGIALMLFITEILSSLVGRCS